MMKNCKKRSCILIICGTLLRSKIDETKLGKSLKFGETSLVIVSPAVVPDVPIKPKKALNVAVSASLGLMLSIGLVFILHQLNNTVNTPEDVEEVLGLQVLGQIPFRKERAAVQGGGV